MTKQELLKKIKADEFLQETHSFTDAVYILGDYMEQFWFLKCIQQLGRSTKICVESTDTECFLSARKTTS